MPTSVAAAFLKCHRAFRSIPNAEKKQVEVTSIVLADDDVRFRVYLRDVLVQDASVQLVGEAADGESVLRLVDQLHPDILLVDVVMPGLNGIATTRRALATNPHLKVIVFSLHDERRMVEAALEAGASGYLLKDHLDRELSDALRAIGRGETFLSASLAKR